MVPPKGTSCPWQGVGAVVVGGCVGVVVSTGDVVTIGDVVGGAVVVSSVMCYEDNTMVWDISFINNQNE